MIIIRAIKRRYKFKKVTRVILKHILYEGAKINHILCINDDCFEKMVDILNLPLDEMDEDDEHLRPRPQFTNQSRLKRGKYSKIHLLLIEVIEISNQTVQIGNPNEDRFGTCSDGENEGEPKKITVTSDFHSVDYTNNNQFKMAEDHLKQIYEFEHKNPEILDLCK